jgi:cell wall-associated NlpC family hydrolase
MVPSTLPLRLLAGLLLAALGFAVLPGSAAADPTPSLGEVQRRVDALNKDAADAAERYNTAKVALTETNRKMRSAQNRYAVTKRHLDAMKALVGRIAVASYKSGGVDPTVALVLSEDPQTFLRQAADLSQVTRHQSAMLQGMEAARLQAAVDRKAVADQKARASALQDKIAAEKDAIESRLAQARDVLARLEAKQRERLLAMQRAATQRAVSARSDAPRASRSSRDSGAGNDSAGGGGGSYDGPSSGRAGEAVRTAYAQLGDPYAWGAAGPGSFDCSGLTMYSWASAGVSLPHSSSAQYGVVRHVAISDLQPGDLVFYYSPISHVGIYIGGGKIIDAPYPGLSVHISGLNSMPLVGAGRP